MAQTAATVLNDSFRRIGDASLDEQKAGLFGEDVGILEANTRRLNWTRQFDSAST